MPWEAARGMGSWRSRGEGIFEVVDVLCPERAPPPCTTTVHGATSRHCCLSSFSSAVLNFAYYHGLVFSTSLSAYVSLTFPLCLELHPSRRCQYVSRRCIMSPLILADLDSYVLDRFETTRNHASRRYCNPSGIETLQTIPYPVTSRKRLRLFVHTIHQNHF